MWRKLPIFLVCVVLCSDPGAVAQAAIAPLVWPVDGEVVTAYRNGDDPYAAGMHRGIDVGAPIGTRVRAAVGGTASFAGRAPDGALDVTIRSRDGKYLVSHVHLASVAVRRDDTVAAGETIGTVGRTGLPSTTQPHLHLGVRLAATHAYVDPLTLLPPLPGRPVPTGHPAAEAVRAEAQAPVTRPVAKAGERAAARGRRPVRLRQHSAQRLRSVARGERPATAPVATPRAGQPVATVRGRNDSQSRSGRAESDIAAPGLGRRTARAASVAAREKLTTRAEHVPAASPAGRSRFSAAPASHRGPNRRLPLTLGLLIAAGVAAALLWHRRFAPRPTPRPVEPIVDAAPGERQRRTSGTRHGGGVTTPT